MRGALCPLSRTRPPLSSFSTSSFQPVRTVLTIFSYSFSLPSNLFYLLPPAPLVLSLTRYYLCRWASQFLYIICKEPSLEGRQNGLEWTENEGWDGEEKGEGEKVKGSETFKIAESALCKFPIHIVENTEKIMNYRSYNRTFLNPKTDTCRWTVLFADNEMTWCNSLAQSLL